MNHFFCAVFILLSLSVFSQDTYTVLGIPKDLKEHANSVLMKEIIEVDVSNMKKQRFKTHTIHTVFNQKGMRNVDTHISYNDDQRVLDAEIFVYDALGNEIDHIKKRDFKDVSAADGFSLYIDDRILYHKYIPKAYPFIIEVIFETESNSTAYIPRWFPIGSYNQSTQLSTYTLTFDPKNTPKIDSKNIEDYEITIAENTNTIVGKAKNIPALRREPLSPSFSNIAPNLAFALDRFYFKGVPGQAKDWNEFGQWMSKNLLQDVQEIPETTILEIRNLVAKEPTSLEKAKKIYQYLQEKVRYISIQIGIGGWKPTKAMDVDKLGYGDCKGLTNYTKSLLAAVGIDSYYTILYAGNEERDIRAELPALQGNHAILGIPNEDEIVWLECTSQDHPFGFGGNFSDDREVFIVTPKGGEIVHTKAYDFNDNRQDSKITIEVQPTGGVSASFQSTSTGLQYDDKFTIVNESEKDTKTHYLERWGSINNLSIETIDLNNDKDNIVFAENIQITVANYCAEAGEEYLFAPNIFNRTDYVPPRIKERKQDFVLSEGFQDTDTVIVKLPKTLTYENLPKNESITTDFGSYIMNFKKIDEESFQYTREFSLKKGQFPAQQYNEYRSFRRKVSKKDNIKMILSNIN